MRLSFQQPALQALWQHLGRLRFSSAGLAQNFVEGAPSLSFHDHPQLLRPFFETTRTLESALEASEFSEDSAEDRCVAYERNVLHACDEEGLPIAQVALSTFMHLRGTMPNLSPWGTSYSLHELVLPNRPLCTNLQAGSRDRTSELVVSQNVAMLPDDHYQLSIYLKAASLRTALRALGHDVGASEPLWRTALSFSHALASNQQDLFADGFVLDGTGGTGERHQHPLAVEELDALFSGGVSVFPASPLDLGRKWTVRTAGNPYFVQNEQAPLFAVETNGENVGLFYLRTRRTPLARAFARLFDFLLERQLPEARRDTGP